MITAVVGAGGKTTLIHKLAGQFRAKGKHVFVTTTTHMFIEDDTLLTESADAIIEQLTKTGYTMAGLPCGEKIAALPRAVYDAVCECADEVLVEADGSKHYPLKFPNEQEPVIPENAEKVIIVCGLHALGKRAKEAVFRLEYAKRCVDIDWETIIAPQHICQLLRKGYIEPLRAMYPDMKLLIHAVHDGTDYQQKIAKQIEQLI